MESSCCMRDTLTDYLTGIEKAHTGEEMVRQKVERFLVEEKGYLPEDIEVDRPFELAVDNCDESGRAELVVFIGGRPFMTLKCAPGSLVTREREALAASRLAFEQYQVPLTVVTNGDNAEVIDTTTAKVIQEGMDAIPDKKTAQERIADLRYLPLAEGKKEKESRIFHAYCTFQCPLECN